MTIKAVRHYHRRSLLADPEFRALYLDFQAARAWSPDDPRLDALADRAQRWLARSSGTSAATALAIHDPLLTELVT